MEPTPLRSHDYRFDDLDSLIRADRRRAEIAQLDRMAGMTDAPKHFRLVYMPPAGSIARGLLFRSY